MSEEFDATMDKIINLNRDALIDSFAEFVSAVNEGRYNDAAVFAYGLSYALDLTSKALAIEALARGQELDKPK